MKVLIILLMLFCDSLVFNLGYFIDFPVAVSWIWVVCSTAFLCLPFMRKSFPPYYPASYNEEIGIKNDA